MDNELKFFLKHSASANRLRILASVLGQERVKFNEKLTTYTASKLSAVAQAFFIATEVKELVEALNSCWGLKIPWTILGAGTKMVVEVVNTKKNIPGLVIKNRSNNIKVGAVKGRVDRHGLGIEEALVEIDSGVTLKTLNEFLNKQNLTQLHSLSSNQASLGGSLFLDPNLKAKTEKLKVWENEEIFDINQSMLKRGTHVILSAVLRVKAKQ